MPWVSGRITTPQQDMAFSDSKIRFIWSTDEHISGPSLQTRRDNLKLAVDDCNVWRPNAYVSTGDLSSNDVTYLNTAFGILSACQRPVYVAIGNHDEEEVSYGAGHPNTEPLTQWNAFNQSAPFYKSDIWTSGDGTVSALVLVLDGNIYDDHPPDDISPDHEPGDRVGAPGDAYWRQFGVQLDWVTAQLSTHPDQDFVIVITHYPPTPLSVGNMTDWAALVDRLRADGRAAIGFSGHTHSLIGSCSQASTDEAYTLTVYVAPSLLDAFGWVRVTLDGPTVESAIIQHYTDPGEWVVGAPFTVA